MVYERTPAQAAILDAVERGDENIIISAVAGAGKTTLLVEALNHIHPENSICALVFGKRNSDDLKARCPAYVDVRTLNALGNAALRQLFRGLDIKPGKTRMIAKEMNVDGKIRSVVVRLVGLAKSSGILPRGVFDRDGLVPDVDASWLQLLAFHDIKMPEKVKDIDVVEPAREVLKASCLHKSLIDYDDQLLLAFAHGAPLPQYDWVMLDEAQDTSPLQIALVKRAIAPGGRLIAVGDENQSIMLFRGAGSDSMDVIKRTFNCRPYPLHVSYRCPKVVVEEAQKYVRHIQAHPNAKEGTRITTPVSVEEVDVRAGDMVLCRFSAPAVRAVFAFIRRGIPAVMHGRDVGKNIIALARQMESVDMPDLLSRLGAWESQQRTMADDDEEKQQRIGDLCDSLRVFAEQATSLADLEKHVEAMFKGADASTVVTCSTMHAAKGLEAKRVFIIDWEKPSRARLPHHIEQENNLRYVAVTRSKDFLHLGLIGSSGDGSSAPPPRPWVALTGDTWPSRAALPTMGAKYDTAEHPGVWSCHPSKLDMIQSFVNSNARPDWVFTRSAARFDSPTRSPLSRRRYR